MNQQRIITPKLSSKLNGQTRLSHLDGMKIFLSILVVMHHSALAYTIHETWPIRETQLTSALKPFISVNATFFMGAFFFIAGILAPSSFAKLGFKSFIFSKAKRLLLPAVLLALIAKPFLRFLFNQKIDSAHLLHDYLYNFDFVHGWFLIQLFFYCFTYGLLKKTLSNVKFPFEKIYAYVLVMLSLAGITTLINIFSPINTWFFAHTIEPYHFPQYIILFFMGVLYADYGKTLNTATLLLCSLTSIFLMALYIINFTFHIFPSCFEHLWSSGLGIAMTFSLVGFFERFGSQRKKWKSKLGNATFGVYLVHIFIVILINKSLLELSYSPIEKFCITSTFSIVASFLIVIGAQRLRSLLSTCL